MARYLDGTGFTGIETSSGQLGGTVTAWSFGYVLRMSVGGRFQRIFRMSNGGTGYLTSLITDTGLLRIFSDANSVDSTFIASAGEWLLLTGSKAAGTQPISAGMYRYSTDTWSRETLASRGDPVGAATTINHGYHVTASGVGLDGDLAVGALWKRSLTATEFDSLPYSIAAWLSLAPSGLWAFDQSLTSQALLDLTGGGANQTAISGTSISTASVPILSYGHPILAVTHTSGGAPPAATAPPPFRSTYRRNMHLLTR